MCRPHRCVASRELLKHHQRCTSSQCPVCTPVKQYVQKQRQVSLSQANAARQQQQQHQQQQQQVQQKTQARVLLFVTLQSWLGPVCVWSDSYAWGETPCLSPDDVGNKCGCCVG